MSQAAHTNITRRSILAGLGASIPATTVAAAPVFASSNSDKELLALGRQWEAAAASFDAHQAIFNAAEDRYLAIKPRMPEALKKTEADVSLGLTLPLDKTNSLTFEPSVFNTWRGKRSGRFVKRPATPEIRQQYGLPEDATDIERMEPWPEKQARADEIIKAWDDWQEGIARAEHDSGLEQAEAEQDRLSDVERGLCRQIVAMPAHTVEGIRLKARVYAWLMGGKDDVDQTFDEHLENGRNDEALVLGIVLDLLMMEKAQNRLG